MLVDSGRRVTKRAETEPASLEGRVLMSSGPYLSGSLCLGANGARSVLLTTFGDFVNTRTDEGGDDDADGSA
jgi:hypothetical protein